MCQKKDDEARGYLKEDANDNGLKNHPKDIWILKSRSIIRVSQTELKR